jgi:hypothetical protein
MLALHPDQPSRNQSGLTSPPSGSGRREFGLADRAILVSGSPRSGTTWVAKLLDSHPDVLYRHEPDEVSPPIPGADPRSQLVAWIHERRLRSAAKAPFFRKSWLPRPLALLRTTVARGLKSFSRLTGSDVLEAAIPIPDIVPINRQANLRPAVKLVHWDVSEMLSAVPQCRGLFILRHPCGQIASTMRGVAEGHVRRTKDQAVSPAEAEASRFAASNGVDAAAYSELPDAAKWAWIWRCFNEPILSRIAALPNIRVVLYEQLCSDPHDVTRDLFRFVGLDWHPQTEDFISGSTQNTEDSGYYAVFRNSAAVAESWRQTMAREDQEAVRLVVRNSPAAHYWPELK